MLSFKDGSVIHRKVQHLVARMFMDPKPEGHEINHIDGNPSNNRLDNLEWVTHSENVKHAYQIRREPPEMPRPWTDIISGGKATS